MKYGARFNMTINSTSPAKMFPNKRKENDIILANSLINSRTPTNVPTKYGLCNGLIKNFLAYLEIPMVAIPKN